MDEGQRTYSEEEFGEVLRQAAELAREADTSEPFEHRITLGQMREVAAEAGLDPDLVERAARLLPARPEAPGPRPGDDHRAGGRLVAWFPTEMSRDRADRVLSVIRATARQKGEGEATASGLVWQDATVVATIHNEASGSRVEVTAKRALGFVLPIVSGPLVAMLSFINSNETFGEAIVSVVLGLVVAVVLGVGMELRTRKRVTEAMRAIRHVLDEMGREPDPSVGAPPEDLL